MSQKEKDAFIKDPIEGMNKIIKSYNKANKNNPDKPFKHKIVTLSDKQIADIDMNKLGSHTVEELGTSEHHCGIYNIVKSVHDEEGKHFYNQHAKDGFEKLKKSPPKVRISSNDVTGFFKRTNDALINNADFNLGKSSKAEIKNISATIKSLSNFCKKNSFNRIKTEEELNLFSETVKNLSEQCKDFLKKYPAKEAEEGKELSTHDKATSIQIRHINGIKTSCEKMLEEFTPLMEKQKEAIREEALIKGYKEKILPPGEEQPKPDLGTISSNIKLDFNSLFTNRFSNDKAVRTWVTEQSKGKQNYDWIKNTFAFDFPAKYDASGDFVNQIREECTALYNAYKKATSGDSININNWKETVEPMANNLRLYIDQYNKFTDCVFLDDPKMHALNRTINGIQAMSEKIADKINVPKEERLEALKNKLIYYSFNINNGAEKHSNSKEFNNMKDALDNCAMADKIDATLLEKLSRASEEYLSKKTSGIHIKSFADPVREFRLDLASTLKQIADGNIQRVRDFDQPDVQKEALPQLV